MTDDAKHETTILPETAGEQDRRRFLAACGRFAAITPPAMSILLSTAVATPAIAQSGGGGHEGHHANNGWGNGGGDGVPGRSHHSDHGR